MLFFTRARDTPADARARAGGFRLMRYFSLTSLAAFGIVALAVYVLQTMEERFFERVQNQQWRFFVEAQSALTRQQEQAAREGLLTVHEAAHVNLARVFANVLWRTDFAPFVEAAQRVSVDQCRAGGEEAPATSSTASRSECFAKVGKAIMALPGFDALDRKAYATMQTSQVFKIKVFDLRGVTVYSSEHGQIGEDKADNAGWKSAVRGRPASELTHRDRFSAFEGVVENRDLISSYLPARAPGSDAIVGVFEIYSDATPFLAQIHAASARLDDVARSHRAMLQHSSRESQDSVNASSVRFIAIVYGLLALLYIGSLMLVRNGQRIIDAQARAEEQLARREQLWHREKMGWLATMAANVSHEVGNPLAIISGFAQDIAERPGSDEATARQAKGILEQTWRIAGMTRDLAAFASLHGDTLEPVDVNPMIKSLCDFLAFDRRFRDTPIEFRPGDALPACTIVPDHLNEVLMSLLQLMGEQDGAGGEQRRIVVETMAPDATVRIRISREPGAAKPDAFDDWLLEPRLELAQRRLAGMGATLSTAGNAIDITLQCRVDAAAVRNDSDVPNP